MKSKLGKTKGGYGPDLEVETSSEQDTSTPVERLDHTQLVS